MYETSSSTSEALRDFFHNLALQWWFWFILGWLGSIAFKIFLYDAVVLRLALGPKGLIRGRKLIKRTIEWGDSRVIQTSFGKARVVHRTAPGEGETRRGELCVLIHGFAGSADVYLNSERSNYAAILIKEGYDVLTFDLYGTGYSESPDVSFSAELFCAELVEILVSLRLNLEPFHIVAHSMGSAVALTFCYRFPQLVRRMVFLSPSISDSPMMLSLRIALYVPILREVLSAIIIPTFGEGSNTGNPGMVRSCYRLIMTRLKSGGGWNSRGLLQCNDMLKEMALQQNALTDKLLLLWGARDTVIRIEETLVLRRIIPFVNMCVHPDADHMSFSDGTPEEKEFFANRIVAFLGEGKAGVAGDAKCLVNWSLDGE